MQVNLCEYEASLSTDPVQGQTGQHRETLSQKSKSQKKQPNKKVPGFK